MPIHIDVEEFVKEIAPLFLQDKFARIAEEARTEGRAEGKAEGKAEGLVMMLIKILEHRFGPLDAKSRARILKADADTLLSWTDRVWDVKAPSDLCD